ncbi:MAG TPA: hypothetical protein V6C65_38985 [Allocoleopsis sp.]
MNIKPFLVMNKIYDPDNTLSLSNIAFMVLTIKIALASNLDWVTMTSFMLILLNHNSKKWFQKNKADRQIASQNQLAQSQSELESIKSELKSVVQIINMRGK